MFNVQASMETEPLSNGLKRPFIIDTGEASMCSLFRSIGRQSSKWWSSTWEDGLEKAAIGYIGKHSAHSVFWSCERWSSSQCNEKPIHWLH